MTLKNTKKEKAGLFVLGIVAIALFIIARIDWLGYKAVDIAESKCIVAYLNLKQVVFDLPADEDELSDFVEDVGSTKGDRLNIPPDGVWIWQARFWQSENGGWFWQDYKRQRATNIALAQRLTATAHLIEAKVASIMQEAIKEKGRKQAKWETILADIGAASTISSDDDGE